MTDPIEAANFILADDHSCCDSCEPIIVARALVEAKAELAECDAFIEKVRVESKAAIPLVAALHARAEKAEAQVVSLQDLLNCTMRHRDQTPPCYMGKIEGGLCALHRGHEMHLEHVELEKRIDRLTLALRELVEQADYGQGSLEDNRLAFSQARAVLADLEAPKVDPKVQP